MTGPEHYLRSQELLHEASGDDNEYAWAALMIAGAQVHATLALAAATAESGRPGGLGTPSGMHQTRYQHWDAAMGVPK